MSIQWSSLSRLEQKLVRNITFNIFNQKSPNFYSTMIKTWLYVEFLEAATGGVL